MFELSLQKELKHNLDTISGQKVAKMSSQQFPRHGLPASSGGAPQISAAGNLVSVSQPSNAQGNFFSTVIYSALYKMY